MSNEELPLLIETKEDTSLSNQKKIPVTLLTGFLGSGKVFIKLIHLKYLINLHVDYIFELYLNTKPWQKNCCNTK